MLTDPAEMIRFFTLYDTVKGQSFHTINAGAVGRNFVLASLQISQYNADRTNYRFRRYTISKSLGSWSAIRKYLEQEMLCESLRGKIRYSCTTYPNMDSCSLFRVYLNNEEQKRFSHETVNSYFIQQGFKEPAPHISGKAGYWNDYWKLLQEIPVAKRTEYTDEEFCEALSLYRNQDIQTSLQSNHPIIMMFALLDRRVVARTLAKIENDIKAFPQWVQTFYNLRILR